MTVSLPALAARGIAVSWGGRPVLRDVDLELGPATICALEGINGAGKTTLVRVLAGALVPDGGRIALGEVDPRADRRAYVRRVGLTAAGDRGVYARLDVRANLELAAGLALVARRRGRALVAAALDRFDLGTLAHRRGDELSLGQRQRVRLAIAFLHEPDLVLLDEPTSSLDADATALVARALREHAARGGTALWTTPAGTRPDLPATRRLALVDGRLHELR